MDIYNGNKLNRTIPSMLFSVLLSLLDGKESLNFVSCVRVCAYNE